MDLKKEGASNRPDSRGHGGLKGKGVLRWRHLKGSENWSQAVAVGKERTEKRWQPRQQCLKSGTEAEGGRQQCSSSRLSSRAPGAGGAIPGDFKEETMSLSLRGLREIQWNLLFPCSFLSCPGLDLFPDSS